MGTRTAPTRGHINRRYSTVYFLHPLGQTKTPTRAHSFPTCLCCRFVRLPPSCCESFARLEQEYTLTHSHTPTHTHTGDEFQQSSERFPSMCADCLTFGAMPLGEGGSFSTSILPHQRRGMSLDPLSPPAASLPPYQQVASPELTCYLGAYRAPKRSRGHRGVLPSADSRCASLARRRSRTGGQAGDTSPQSPR